MNDRPQDKGALPPQTSTRETVTGFSKFAPDTSGMAQIVAGMNPDQTSKFFDLLISKSDPSDNTASPPQAHSVVPSSNPSEQIKQQMDRIIQIQKAKTEVTLAEIAVEVAKSPDEIQKAHERLTKAKEHLENLTPSERGSDQGSNPNGQSSQDLPDIFNSGSSNSPSNSNDIGDSSPVDNPAAPTPAVEPGGDINESPKATSPQRRKYLDYRYKKGSKRDEASQQENALGGLSSETKQVIDKLVTRANLGNERDISLLKEALACVHPELLKRLLKSGYQIVASRDNVTHAIPDIAGRDLGGTPIDTAVGLHSTHPGDGRKIIITTRMQDGELTLNFSTLMHEIGHAVSINLYDILDVINSGGRKSCGSDAINLNSKARDAFLDAFRSEKSLMPRDYYKSEAEFLAETFAMYCMRPDELRAKMPRTYQAYELLRTEQAAGSKLPWPPVLFDRLLDFQREKTPEPVLEGGPRRARQVLSRIETRNDLRRQKGAAGESHAFLVNGEEDAVRILAEAMGRDLCAIRDGRPPYDNLEGCIRITQSLLNDPQELFKKLTGSIGAVLYIPAELNLAPNSPFFEAFNEFRRNNNGVCHLLISGNAQTLEGFKNNFGSDIPPHLVELGVANPKQLIELIRRAAHQESYELSDDAVTSLEGTLKIGGTFADAQRMWAKIKAAHLDRILSDDGASQLVDIADIAKAGIKQAEDPLEVLRGLTGLTAAKKKIEGLVARAKVDRELGNEKSRRNPAALVFSGNPGTGKTTVARLVGEILAKEGVVKRPNVQMLKAADLARLGKDGAFKELLKGKNGTIFIDEFHQLDPSEGSRDGKEIINLLVPILTDPEWKDTVFIFAGYEGKIRDLLKNDDGLPSRFEFVPFEDYSRDELRTIAEGMLKSRDIICDESVLAALCDRVDELQRSSQYPGNARDIEKTIEAVLEAQAQRLAKMNSAERSGDVLKTILIEDVVVKRQYSPDDILSEFDQKFVGNAEIRKLLVDVKRAVELNKKKNRDIFKNVPMAILVEGGPGTGKKELSELIVRFYHSLGLLSKDSIKTETGGKLVGGYEGNSSELAVQKQFDAALGGGLIIKQIKGITDSRAFSEKSVGELKNQLEDKSKRILFIGIDTPENMDKFLNFDSSIADRFKRIEAKRLNLESATELFTRLAKTAAIGFEAGYQDVIAEKLSQIVSAPGFASGRDIKQIIDRLQQEEEYDEADGDKEHVFSKQVLTTVLDQILKEVLKRPGPKGQKKADSGSDIPVQSAVDIASKKEELQERQAQREPYDTRVRDAMVKVSQTFAELANSDPERFMEMQKDSNSEYYKKLGIELGIDSQKAFEEATKTLEELKEQKTKLKQQFDYVCFACGQTNSSGCVFFSNSEMAKPEGGWQFSLEWLMLNSQQGPYLVEDDGE